MAFLQSSVQSQLLAALRTGHPVVDAVVTTLLVCMVTAAAAHGRTLLLELWLRLRHALDRCTITVRRQDVVPRGWYDEHLLNLDYQALVWYLTDVAQPVRGHTTALRVRQRDAKEGEYEEVFLPAQRQPVAVCFEGRPLRLYTDHDVIRDDKSYRTFNERIVVCAAGPGVGMALLRRFLDHVRASHAAHVKGRSWQQRLFRLKRDPSDAKKGLVWVGALTHSSKTFDTVVIDAPVKAALIADFRNYLRSEEWYRTMGLAYKRGYMFHGPPGTGKSSMVLALANEGQRDIYSLDLSKMNSDADLDQAFEQLPDSCLVVLEDVDAMGAVTHARQPAPPGGGAAPAPAACSPTAVPGALVEALLAVTGADDMRPHQGVSLSALLNHLDGVGSNHGRVFVLTTNHPELLDAALVRPGRVDMKVHLGLCSRDQQRQFYALYFDDHGAGDGAHVMDDVPSDKLTPADVSSCFQHFRGQPELAVAELRRLAAQRQSTQQ